jgi:hypothetical protein
VTPTDCLAQHGNLKEGVNHTAMTTPAHRHDDKGLLPKIGHQLVHIYDWLSGPAMTEQERIHREIIETEPLRRVGSFPI